MRPRFLLAPLYPWARRRRHRLLVPGAALPTALLLLLSITPAAPAVEWAPTAKLLASDADALDHLGYVVATDGDRIAVATPWDDDVAPDAGAAYVFERDGEGRWFEAAKLTAPDAEGCCWYLGTSVGISGDTLVATAPGADPVGFIETGAVYVFERDRSGVWRPARKLKALDVEGEPWASSVAIDGDLIAVGASRDDDAGGDAGAIYLFERDAGGPGRWGPVAKLLAADDGNDDRLGWSVALDGDRLVAGALTDDDRGSDAGAAYVFDRDADGEWSESAKLTASDGDSADNLGWSVDVHGETAVVGAPDDEDGGNNAGSAYVFGRDDGGAWIEVTKLKSLDLDFGDDFGESVAIDGDLVVIGASGDGPSVGAVYVFERDRGGPGRWGEAAKLTLADGESADEFGKSMALNGRTVVAGARGRDDQAFDAGAAYVFVRVEPRLAVAGSCPGTLELRLSGATPSRPVALLWGSTEGSTPVPAGRCAGTDLALEDPDLLAIRRADPDGSLSLVRAVGRGACGRLLQVLDGFTCEASGVEQLP